MNLYKSFISFIAGLALLGWAGSVSAQNETDALRYSRTYLSGTARIQGIAGAQTAIGADIGSLAGNPAGLGLFRRSEFSVTPSITATSTESRINGGPPALDSRSNMNFPSIGVVVVDRRDDATEGDWRSGNFGIGFTRLNNFNSQFNYAGTTASPNTIVQSFGEMAVRNGRNFDNLEDEFATDGTQIYSLEGLAYATYLLNVDENDGNLYLENQGGEVNYGEQVNSWGAQNQFDLSYGASYRDRIFIGGSIGINRINFRQERTFRETDNDPETDFQQLALTDEFSTQGSGVHGRLGVIFRPSDILRFGATIQTPTLYTLTDRYRSRLSVDYNPGFFSEAGRTNVEYGTAPGEFQYRLTTPMRASVGAAYFFRKSGFLTADVEYVNYATARLAARDADGSFNEPNNLIRSNYSPTINIKVGGEARVDIFRFRAGYALFGDPTGSGGAQGARSFFTGGGGIRLANYYLDAAVVHGRGTEQYSPYSLNNSQQPVVSTDARTTSGMITIGLNF